MFIRNIVIHFTSLLFSISILAAEVKKLDDGLFYSKTKDGLIFILEKIDLTNFKVWMEYFSEASKAVDKAERIETGDWDRPIKTNWGKTISSNMAHDMSKIANASVLMIKNKLAKIEQTGGTGWIAYIREDNSIEKMKQSAYNFIVMSIFVFSNPSTPIEVHELFLRNPINYLQKEPKFKNLSLRLNGFAAKAIEASGLKNIYMIFTPEKAALEIFKNAISDDIFVGADSPRLKKVGDWGSHYFSFKIFDKNKKNILSVNSANILQYDWLFSPLSYDKDYSPFVLVDIEALKKQF